MSAQPHLSFASKSAATTQQELHPAALQTIDLIEHALAELLSSLRGQAAADAPDSPGAIEYASWLPVMRSLHR